MDPSPPGTRHGARAGFTMVELVVVVTMAAAVLAIFGGRITDWRDRTAARQAAQVFARDLAHARAASARGQEAVVVHFYESSRWYSVTTASGREVARRRFGAGDEIFLSAIDLATPGDSLQFGPRGVADLTAVGTLGEAHFTAGQVSFTVAFNSLGTSTVGPR